MSLYLKAFIGELERTDRGSRSDAARTPSVAELLTRVAYDTDWLRPDQVRQFAIELGVKAPAAQAQWLEAHATTGLAELLNKVDQDGSKTERAVRKLLMSAPSASGAGAVRQEAPVSTVPTAEVLTKCLTNLQASRRDMAALARDAAQRNFHETFAKAHAALKEAARTGSMTSLEVATGEAQLHRIANWFAAQVGR